MPETSTRGETTHESYILFEVAGTTYGLCSRDVQHMEMVGHITPMPNAHSYVEGVIYSRGQVIPAVNLRLRFGFPRQEHTLRSRLIVVQSGQRRVGLLVDSAREFRHLPAASILPPAQAAVGVSENYLAGIAPVGERLIVILNVDELLKTVEVEGEGRVMEPVPTR
jgi:purine-binding chemotaxis protein CheW